MKYGILMMNSTAIEYLFSEGALWNEGSTRALAKQLNTSSKITFQGIYTHEGHSYNARGRQQIEVIADEATDRLLHLAARYGIMSHILCKITHQFILKC
jgi:D-serine deaminase-like pyridoxal phosphate-dependent protein